MTKRGILEAEREAKRLLGCIHAVLMELPQPKGEDWGLPGSKATGALRRASLDLTRTLARMRRA